MKKVLFSLLIAIFITASAFALPSYINYQGVLRDNAGNLVTGKKAVTVNIYNAATGGTSLWDMASPEVNVNNGLYTMKLGPLDATVLGGSGSRWLELTVGTDVLSPRLEILGVAYAIMAASAETAGNANTVGGYLPAATGNSIIPITDGGGKLNAAVIPASGSITYVPLSGQATNAATANYATLSGTASNAANANLLQNFPVSTEAGSGNRILALNGNKIFKGVAISAEAVGNPYAVYSNGKIGLAPYQVGNGASGFPVNCVVGRGTLSSSGSTVIVYNSYVTASSLIFISPIFAAAGASYLPMKIDSVSTGNFVVETFTGSSPFGDQDFFYLVVN